MENNEAFEAEAALEARSQSYRSKRHGNGRVKAVSGGLGSRTENEYDETSLLSREINHDYGSSTEASDNGDTRGPPEWSGERDFEGRPWWSKPSVSQEHLDVRGQLLTKPSGLLAITTFLPIHSRLGRNRRSKTQPDIIFGLSAVFRQETH